MWLYKPHRTPAELWIDRSLCTFLMIVVLVNLFNLYQVFDIASWEELRVLIGLSFLAGVLVPLLWIGAMAGLEVVKIFYALQVPSTLALGTFFYDIDGGIKITFGYLNSLFHFNFLLFNTHFSIGLLDANKDGYAYGLVINMVALGLAIYYFMRTRANKQVLNQQASSGEQ